MVSETTYNISGAQIGNELLASTRSLTSSGWRDSSQEMPPKISVGDVPTPNILQKRCYQISNIQHEHLRKLTSYPCSLKFEEPFFARCSASTMIEQINILCKNKFQPSCKYKYFNMLFSDFHPNHSWNLGQVASTFNFDKFCKGFTQRAIDSCGTLCLGCHLTNARFQQIFVEKREFPKCYMSLCFLPLFGMLKYRNSTFWYNYWYYLLNNIPIIGIRVSKGIKPRFVPTIPFVVCFLSLIPCRYQFCANVASMCSRVFFRNNNTSLVSP